MALANGGLRSEKQMDIKLFTEFLLKKMIHQKTWLLWKTHFPLMVQSSLWKHFNTTLTKTEYLH